MLRPLYITPPLPYLFRKGVSTLRFYFFTSFHSLTFVYSSPHLPQYLPLLNPPVNVPFLFSSYSFSSIHPSRLSLPPQDRKMTLSSPCFLQNPQAMSQSVSLLLPWHCEHLLNVQAPLRSKLNWCCPGIQVTGSQPMSCGGLDFTLNICLGCVWLRFIIRIPF